MNQSVIEEILLQNLDDFRKRYERFAREYGENESCIRQYVESTSGVLSAFMEKTKLVKDNYSDMDLEIWHLFLKMLFNAF